MRSDITLAWPHKTVIKPHASCFTPEAEKGKTQKDGDGE